MAAVKRIAGSPIETGDYIPVGVIAGSTSGTEYTEGDIEDAIVGQAVLFEDTSDTLRVPSADNPLPVEVIAGATSGTEYTEGATDATITGRAILFEDAGDTLVVPSASKPLPIEQAALVATVDTVTAKIATDAIQNGLTALTPKFVIIDAATSGNNTILAAVTSKKIRVLSLFVVAAGAVVVRFESGADGTALTGQMNLAANGGFVLPFNPVGWFETASNTLLNMELGGAVSVDGSLCYVEV